jgi:hypothetical protein
MKKLLNKLKGASGKIATGVVAAVATVQAHAVFTPPTAADTAAADAGEAITWAIGIGWTLAAASVVGVISIGLFKKFAKKGAS